MLAGIDHIIILVDNLDEAVQTYRDWGFTIGYGGEHASGKTHNAIVVLHDNSYLEILAFKQPDPTHPWYGKPLGLVDIALLPTAIVDDIAAARSRGIEFGEIRTASRRRPDGQLAEGQIARASAPDLPFLCGDLSARALRYPTDATPDHANGAQGVAEVHMVVNDLAASADRYRALLGVEPVAGATDRRIAFPIGEALLVLIPQRAGETREGARQLTLRTTRRPDGHGGYSDVPGSLVLGEGRAVWL